MVLYHQICQSSKNVGVIILTFEDLKEHRQSKLYIKSIASFENKDCEGEEKNRMVQKGIVGFRYIFLLYPKERVQFPQCSPAM